MKNKFCCVQSLKMSLMFSCSVMSDSLWPHGLQSARLPCLSLSKFAQNHAHWVGDYLIISSSTALFSFYIQFFPASGSFSMSQLFASGGQSTRASVSASVLPMSIQGLISLQPLGLSRVFSRTTIQKHQFFGTQPSLRSNSHVHTCLLEKP